MKILGLITEYNPFHNGHLYHIEQAKKLINPDLTICVMSSSFTMRGDLSIVDKFTKAKEALYSGIDIVIELPFTSSTANADIFAKKAIELLNSCEVTDLVIGSEANDVTIFNNAYIEWNKLENQEIIKEYMNNGYSYKYATSKIINLPSNDLLGFSYYKAIKESSSTIKLHTIKRQNNNYLDTNLNEVGFSSATSIRANLDKIESYTPNYSFMKTYSYLDSKKLYQLFQYKVITSSLDDLKNYYLVDEGIEGLFKKNINKDFDDFLASTVSKRYTASKIKRTMLAILFSLKRNDMVKEINSKCNYLRVLGYNEFGKSYLNILKKHIMIYTNIKDGINYSLNIELTISKILDITYSTSLFKKEQGAPIYLENKSFNEIDR